MSIREPEYNRDKSRFYFLADKDKGIKISDKNVNTVTLNFYDIVTKKIIKVWSQEDGELVNFFVGK